MSQLSRAVSAAVQCGSAALDVRAWLLLCLWLLCELTCGLVWWWNPALDL